MHEPVQPESMRTCASMPAGVVDDGEMSVTMASNCLPPVDLMSPSSSDKTLTPVSESSRNFKSSIEDIFASMGDGTCGDL